MLGGVGSSGDATDNGGGGGRGSGEEGRFFSFEVVLMCQFHGRAVHRLIHGDC